jgi:hypothetical protein
LFGLSTMMTSNSPLGCLISLNGQHMQLRTKRFFESLTFRT